MKKKIFLTILLTLFGALLVGFLCREKILVSIGEFVTADDSFERADVAIVLNSTFPKGVLEASDLYREQRISKIALMKERHHDGFDEFARRGLNIPDQQMHQYEVLLKLKVPEKDILLSDRTCESTRQEVEALHDMVKHHPEIRSLVVIGRKPQTRRTRTLLKSTFPKKFPVFMKNSRYDRLKTENWWQDTWYLREISEELLKHVYGAFSHLVPLRPR